MATDKQQKLAREAGEAVGRQDDSHDALFGDGYVGRCGHRLGQVGQGPRVQGAGERFVCEDADVAEQHHGCALSDGTASYMGAHHEEPRGDGHQRHGVADGRDSLPREGNAATSQRKAAGIVCKGIQPGLRLDKQTRGSVLSQPHQRPHEAES